MHADPGGSANFIRCTNKNNRIRLAGKASRLEGFLGSQRVVGNQENDEIVPVRVGAVCKNIDTMPGDRCQYSPKRSGSVTNPHCKLHLFSRLCHSASG